MLKRLLDLLISALLLLIALPLIGICALAIKFDSPGPVFFRQTRVGVEFKPFTVLKLRTMIDNAENLGAGGYAVLNDPRFTSLGLLLRRLSLDELPQLFNVLRGEMSVVGPRPLPASVINQYPEQFQTILKVKPGITGLSQVSGRNELPRRQRLAIDMYYATHQSTWLDLKIMLLTPLVVFSGDGQLNYQSQADVEK